MSGALEQMLAAEVAGAGWLEKCSLHLSFVERRLMALNFLMHELLRMFMNALRDWKPLMDLTWPYRNLEDIAQKGMRVLLNTYKTHEETLGTTAEKAWKVVRVILEEAVHRTLLSCEGDEVLKSGVCGLMSTLKNFEAVKAQDAVN